MGFFIERRAETFFEGYAEARKAACQFSARQPFQKAPNSTPQNPHFWLYRYQPRIFSKNRFFDFRPATRHKLRKTVYWSPVGPMKPSEHAENAHIDKYRFFHFSAKNFPIGENRLFPRFPQRHLKVAETKVLRRPSKTCFLRCLGPIRAQKPAGSATD